MTAAETTHYEVLKIKEGSTPVEIVNAYRKRAKETHPDKEHGDKETFQQVNAAYECLNDASQKKLYDRELRARRMLFAEDVAVNSAPWGENEDEVLMQLVKSRGGEGKWDRKGLPPVSSMLAVLTGSERRTPADVEARVTFLLERQKQQQREAEEQGPQEGKEEAPEAKDEPRNNHKETLKENASNNDSPSVTPATPVTTPAATPAAAAPGAPGGGGGVAPAAE